MTGCSGLENWTTTSPDCWFRSLSWSSCARLHKIEEASVSFAEMQPSSVHVLTNCLRGSNSEGMVKHDEGGVSERAGRTECKTCGCECRRAPDLWLCLSLCLIMYPWCCSGSPWIVLWQGLLSPSPPLSFSHSLITWAAAAMVTAAIRYAQSRPTCCSRQ